jgi:hypothetical protein
MNIFKDTGGKWVTRDEVIESLREMHDIALSYEKRKDRSLVGWPDAKLMLDHIEKHGLPPNAGGKP